MSISARPAVQGDDTDDPALPTAAPTMPQGRNAGEPAMPVKPWREREVSNLMSQNERLSKNLETFIRLHEDEKAQRHALQVTLDRLLEEIRIPAPAQSLETVGTAVRKGVSEDLKPLLHAIIELLELSMRYPPAPARPTVAPEPGDDTDVDGAGDGDAGHRDASGQILAEDLPGALPEILTKSVEELVGKPGASRRKNVKLKGSKSIPGQSTEKNEMDAAVTQRHRLPTAPRPPVWIPVTSGTLKP